MDVTMFFCGVWPPFCEAERGHTCSFKRLATSHRPAPLSSPTEAGQPGRPPLRRCSRRLARSRSRVSSVTRGVSRRGRGARGERRWKTSSRGRTRRTARAPLLREREQVREDVFPRRKLRRVPEMDRDARLVHGTRRPRVRAQRQRRRVRSGRHAAEDAFGSAGVRGLRAGRLRVLVRARGGRGALRPRVRPRRRHLQQPRRRQGALDGKRADVVRRRVDALARDLGVLHALFLRHAERRRKDPFGYRKPRTGAWRHFETKCNGGVSIDLETSYYVGDAAGRPGDHSDSAPRSRRRNVGVRFFTPEAFFAERGLENVLARKAPPNEPTPREEDEAVVALDVTDDAFDRENTP